MATKKTPRKKIAPPKAPHKVSFSDENAVLREIAKRLDIEPDDLSIKNGSAPNGYGDAYTISTQGGRQEWIVMENEDEFETAARLGVENDLQNEPEMFNKDFLSGHINMERLKHELYDGIYDSNYDSLNDEAEQKPLAFIKEHGLDCPSPPEKLLKEYADAMEDEEIQASTILSNLHKEIPEEQWDILGEEPTVPSSDVESIAEQMTNDRLRDPLGYLEDIFGSDATAKAIEFGGIDYKSAADEAVSTDGAAHFMSTYDGNYETSPSGFVYFRHN
jgi:hypothetical protein